MNGPGSCCNPEQLKKGSCWREGKKGVKSCMLSGDHLFPGAEKPLQHALHPLPALPGFNDTGASPATFRSVN